jgi:hypothetical protein
MKKGSLQRCDEHMNIGVWSNTIIETLLDMALSQTACVILLDMDEDRVLRGGNALDDDEKALQRRGGFITDSSEV